MAPGRSLLANAAAAFEDGTDFTLAVEEEFALLDPDSLELVDRFEELYAAAQRNRPRAERRRRADRLRDRGAHRQVRRLRPRRPPRCAERRDAAARARARRSGSRSARTGTHPWARWQDQRIIDTPHYRRNDELLRYVVWRNNTFGLHVHVGIAGADRAIAVHDALRNFLPELLALSASSPFVENVNTGLHSARTEIFTRMFPRCGIPDAYDGWRGLRGLRLVPLPHRLDHRAHADLVERAAAPRLPDVEIRICDGSPTSARRSRSRRSATRSRRAARARYDEGEPLPDQPHRLLEENMWRAIRYGLSGELIDLERGESLPARARIEQLLEWVAPVADEIGAAPFLAVPEQNAAERQIERSPRAPTCAGSTPSRCRRECRSVADEVDPEALADELAAFDVDQFLVGAASTLASLAFAKLEGGDLGQARKAIDTLAALLPHVESGLQGDLERALTNLQVAYASAASG